MILPNKLLPRRRRALHLLILNNNNSNRGVPQPYIINQSSRLHRVAKSDHRQHSVLLHMLHGIRLNNTSLRLQTKRTHNRPINTFHLIHLIRRIGSLPTSLLLLYSNRVSSLIILRQQHRNL